MTGCICMHPPFSLLTYLTSQASALQHGMHVTSPCITIMHTHDYHGQQLASTLAVCMFVIPTAHAASLFVLASLCCPIHSFRVSI